MTSKTDDFSELGEGRRCRFSKDEILIIVRAVERGNSRSEIIRRYGMSKTTLSEWVREFASTAYRERQKPVHPTVRRSIFRAITENQLTMEQVRQEYKLPSTREVRQCVLQTQRENDELHRITLLMPKNEARSAVISSQNAEALKKALEEAELKIKALNTLIDVAEERFKIDIRKKPGAKQSSE